MSDPSSTSMKMLTTLSEIQPIVFYSPSAIGSRSNITSSSSKDIPENLFHSIDLNSSSVPTGPGPHHKMLSDALFEGDLRRNKYFESNILSASEELVIESLAMMREEVRVKQNEPFQGKEIRETQPIFDKLKILGGIHLLTPVILLVMIEKTKSTRESSKGKRKRSQGSGTQRKVEEEVNKQGSVDNLRKQSVVAGRVFDMVIINLPGMDSLHEMVKNQSCIHLFNKKSPILHEEEVYEFYNNIQFQEDGSVHTRVNDIAVHLDEFLLGKILMMTSTTSTDLYVLELLFKFEPLNLQGIMLEHMYKTVIERKGIHGMGYGYFLTEVFKYFNIPFSAGKVGTVKQAFSENTLIECESIEGGPGTSVVQALERKNAELRAKVIALQEKAIKNN
ncbi:hypothetical protein EJD97_014908, partial [Solanum chilense]